MPKYHFIFTGENIHIERGMQLPIYGFVAPRSIMARSEAEAEQRAKIELLKFWKLHFNQDNKAGTPRIEIDLKMRVQNPFRRLTGREEFFFYGNEEEKKQAFDTASKRFRKWLVF